MPRKAVLPPKQCPHCGKQFARRDNQTSSGFRNQIYCCRECASIATAPIVAQKLRQRNTRTVRVFALCPVCGQQFELGHYKGTGRVRTMLYCSAECRRIATHELQWIRQVCAHCGDQFAGPPGTPFCGAECAREHADDGRTCDCGAPASVTLYVDQYDADGYHIDAALHLCATCAAQVSHGRAEPRPLTDDGGWSTGAEVGYHHAAHWTMGRFKT